MKKILLICLILSLASAISFAQSSVKVTNLLLNGTLFSNSGIMIDGVTYAPLRVLAESLGATISFRPAENIIEVTGGVTAPATTPSTQPASPEKEPIIDSPYVSAPPPLAENSYVRLNSYVDVRDCARDARQEAKARETRTYEIFLKRIGDNWINELTLLNDYGVLVIKKGASKIYFTKDNAYGETSAYIISRPKNFNAYVVYKHDGISMQTAYTAEDPETIFYNVADLKEKNII